METQMNWVRDFQQRIELGDTAAMQEFERLCQPTLVRIVRRAMDSQDHSKTIRLLIDHELRVAAALPENAACADPQQAVVNVAGRIAHLLLDGTLRDGPICAELSAGLRHASGPDCKPGGTKSARPCVTTRSGNPTVSQ